jgi:DNA-binding NarL/FixJ family response regulator
MVEPRLSNGRSGPTCEGVLAYPRNGALTLFRTRNGWHPLRAVASKLRLVLAEDSYLVREGVRRLIETDPGLDLVESCADLDGLLRAVDRVQPDVVVTDIRMPPDSTDEGIRAANRFREQRPDLGVVVLSQHDEPEYALKLLERGSARRAYLLKDSLSDPRHLVEAIRTVAEGGSVIDPKVVEALVAARARERGSPVTELTPRERQVLSCMAEGGNNEAIALRLGLSVRMVEKHINAIFSKLGLSEEADVHRRVKAVLIYLSKSGD